MKRHLSLVALATASCATNSVDSPFAEAPSRPPSKLVLFSSDIDAMPKDLRADLRANLHHYYRFLARRFAALECDLGATGPVVNLHGDPHVEQYLVTSLGRGLGDFDEATTGPVSIDLLRLAVSIRIVAAQRGWDSDRLWSSFVDGYQRALKTPSLRNPVPRFADRARASFERDHGAFLKQSMSLMQPISPTRATEIERAFAGFAANQLDQDTRLSVSAFDVVSVGRHGLGVASRVHENYLLRTRGPRTEDPSDDLIFEAKAVTANPEAWCLPSSGEPNVERILVGEARLAYVPFEHEGGLEINGRPYWVHEWVDDYRELSAEDPTLDEGLTAEILVDVGVQLGLGHPRYADEARRAHLRQALGDFVVASQSELWEQARELHGDVQIAWEATRPFL